ncbi:ATP-binding protein [Dactylosporangium sp. NPDC049742]|uniref:sensor histidine kinase n=1 Tax=Dactylosporangium sp. NPDC049742 TaxID=3154737 RepID=UPI00341570C3
MSSAQPRTGRRRVNVGAVSTSVLWRAIRAGGRPALALLAGAAAFPLVGILVQHVGPYIPIEILIVFGIAGIVAITHYAGVVFGVPVALASFLAFDWYYLPPTHPIGIPAGGDLTEAVVFLLLATAVGEFAAMAQRRSVAAETARRLLTSEQAALRRVATLVAQDAPPAEVFGAVAAEVGRIFDTDLATVVRFEPDSTATVVAVWSRRPSALRPGVNYKLDGSVVATAVFQSHCPARVDDYARVLGPAADLARQLGICSTVAAPIVVDRRLWGAAIAAVTRPAPLPAESETRICDFTELLAASIANTQNKAELTTSRARIVAAADETRRRLERELHDRVQQRLISLAIELTIAESSAPPELSDLHVQLSSVKEGLKELAESVRELSRGIHPTILSEGGLEPALKALIRRSTVPADYDIRIDTRFPEGIEVAAYHVVSEALSNVAKHARASGVTVRVRNSDRALSLSVRDDGCGCAASARGSGLTGLEDRVKALGGTIDVVTPPDGGTELRATLPVVSHGGSPPSDLGPVVSP